MGKLKIEHRVLGAVATNVYLAINQDTKEAFLVDPADCADHICKWAKESGVSIKAILLTHGHFDHILAVNDLKRELQIPVYAMAEERIILSDPVLNLSGKWMNDPVTVRCDVELTDEQEFEAAGFKIRAFLTPGHTRGGACYYLMEEGTLFSGDTLFCNSIGRTDLPTGSMGQLVRSARRLVEVLDEDTTVYPGHEADTTIGDEKRFNPYL